MSPASSRRSPVSDMTGRLRRRRRQTLRRRLRIAAVLLLVAALVAGVVWLGWFSPVLASKAVRVTGNRLVSTEQVVTTAQVPIGLPMVRLPVADIRARVAALPQVARVDVHRAWPDTVELRLTERTAVYVLRSGAGLHLVDAEGNAFQPVPEPPGGLVVAELADGAPQRLRADVGRVAEVLTGALASGTISATTPDAIAVTLPDGRQVVFGSAEQARLKADVALKLMAATKAQVYDVSAPSRPVTR